MLSGIFTLLAQVSAHGSAGNIAYSQMDALPVIQIASLLGSAGVVFGDQLAARGGRGCGRIIGKCMCCLCC